MFKIFILFGLAGILHGSGLPQLSIVGDYAFLQRIECRQLTNVSQSLTLSMIPCPTFKMCQERGHCLVDNLTCVGSGRGGILRGENCTGMGQVGHDECQSISPSTHDNSGLVQCLAKEGGNRSRVSVDHFFRGLDYNLYLVSNSSKLPKSAIFQLNIEKYAHRFNFPAQNGLLYTNEEISFTCSATEFLYNKTSLRIRFVKADGSTIEINPPSFFSYSHSDIYHVVLRGFRMSRELVGVACSVKGRDDGPFRGEVRQEIIKFRTMDPPLKLFAKTLEGKLFKFELNETLGCTYNGTMAERNQLNSKLFPISLQAGDEMKFIKSIIEFLRFVQFSGGNYGCMQMVDNNFDNSTQNFDYHVKIVQSPPTIEKSDESTSIHLNGHDHRTLSCKYKGMPRPYVLWFRNDQKFEYKVQTLRGQLAEDGDFETEESLLRLQTNSTDGAGSVNYTCVAVNHLGEDRLHFFIVDDNQSNRGSIAKAIKAGEFELNPWFILSILLGLTSLILVISGYIYRRKYLNQIQSLQNEGQGEQIAVQFNNDSTPFDGTHTRNMAYQVLEEY